MKILPDDVFVIGSKASGPTVAIMAGVHGNEKAGVYALRELLPTLQITRGKLYIVFANPPAIEQDVRMLAKNLNRCFVSGNTGTAYEDVRARELMELLDECDALLDLHMFYDDAGKPFVICEDDALPIAQKLDVDIISTNWTEVEPGGTDGYMHIKGKIGICVECGPISKSQEYVAFAKRTVFQFLRYYNMTDQRVAYSNTPKRLIQAEEAVYKTDDSFVLEPELENFQRLKTNQRIAQNSKISFRAGKNQCVIFPHYKARIGEEAYILGKELTDNTI